MVFPDRLHGMVALDENKQLACKAIIHLDQRSSLELKEIRTLAGNLMTEELLNQPSAGMMISSLYWLKKHQKETYDRIRYVMSQRIISASGFVERLVQNIQMQGQL